MLAFQAPSTNDHLFSASNFSPVESSSTLHSLNSINGNNEESVKAEKLVVTDTDDLYTNTAITDDQVPTG